MPRDSRFELEPERFRSLGHRLIDDLADLLAAQRSPSSLRVTPGESLEEVRAVLGDDPLPERGVEPEEALAEAERLLLDHSLLIGHPRFWGYVVGAPAPLGALGDLLAAVVNPNVGGWPLSPMATELELQTVRWLAELLGYPRDCGGLLVSGGNMANIVGFLAARRAAGGDAVRRHGPAGLGLRAYCSAETHTWIHKAADMSGIGTDAVRWIATDDELRLDAAALHEAVARDRADGLRPFLVVGAAGSVSTGAVDPLRKLAAYCREEGLWLHVDGAYGAFAACLPDAPDDLRALAEADSIAVDPHKWLYAPLEAGCVLVRSQQSLLDTFAYRPPYYHLGDETQFFELGPQNSRGFRALKVWLGLKTAGREGYVEAIGEDVRLAGVLRELVAEEPRLESGPGGLSIATFSYVPDGADGDDEYLNRLNEALVDRLQKGGEAFVSTAVVRDRYFLRVCIVNFRTTEDDVRALPPLVLREGAALHESLRASAPAT